MTAEIYTFFLGEEIFAVPSTVGYQDLISTLGIQTIDLILAVGSNGSWVELEQQSKRTRERPSDQSAQEYCAHAILEACKQLSLSQGRFSLSNTE